mmetsp:Transcript_90030/g.263183  ORF Transcript_90030/g.263183 Transcript_90030/m.263183 type:complete len:211 (+) Transcript_90030:829-1461(+)
MPDCRVCWHVYVSILWWNARHWRHWQCIDRCCLDLLFRTHQWSPLQSGCHGCCLDVSPGHPEESYVLHISEHAGSDRSCVADAVDRHRPDIKCQRRCSESLHRTFARTAGMAYLGTGDFEHLHVHYSVPCRCSRPKVWMGKRWPDRARNHSYRFEPCLRPPHRAVNEPCPISGPLHRVRVLSIILGDSLLHCGSTLRFRICSLAVLGGIL